MMSNYKFIASDEFEGIWKVTAMACGKEFSLCICLEGLRKNSKILNQDSRSS
jgi:hypothetical protein